MSTLNKDQFKLAFINYCEQGGHGYDPWDIAAAWDHYQRNPSHYNYLFEE